MTHTLAPRKLVGVLVPYFNSVVEPELAMLAPAGVANQTARFALDANVLDDICDAAEKLTACGVSAYAVGLSTEAFPGGLELLDEGVAKVRERTGMPVFDPTHAVQAALRALDVRRIAVVTPFDADGNTHTRAAHESGGFDVVAIEGLACSDFAAIPHTPADEIRAVFERADSDDAEALVHVGTGLPVVGMIAEIEQRFAKPVVACNAATYWQTLRETGIDDAVHGFGRLLAEH